MIGNYTKTDEQQKLADHRSKVEEALGEVAAEMRDTGRLIEEPDFSFDILNKLANVSEQIEGNAQLAVKSFTLYSEYRKNLISRADELDIDFVSSVLCDAERETILSEKKLDELLLHEKRFHELSKSGSKADAIQRIQQLNDTCRYVKYSLKQVRKEYDELCSAINYCSEEEFERRFNYEFDCVMHDRSRRNNRMVDIKLNLFTIIEPKIFKGIEEDDYETKIKILEEARNRKKTTAERIMQILPKLTEEQLANSRELAKYLYQNKVVESCSNELFENYIIWHYCDEYESTFCQVENPSKKLGRPQKNVFNIINKENLIKSFKECRLCLETQQKKSIKAVKFCASFLLSLFAGSIVSASGYCTTFYDAIKKWIGNITFGVRTLQRHVSDFIEVEGHSNKNRVSSAKRKLHESMTALMGPIRDYLMKNNMVCVPVVA